MITRFVPIVLSCALAYATNHCSMNVHASLHLSNLPYNYDKNHSFFFYHGDGVEKKSAQRKYFSLR